MTSIVAYLNFDGNCREAMTFYQRCLGGDLQMTRVGDSMPDAPAESKDRLIHARLERGPLALMASDTMPGMPFQPGNDVWLSIHCESDAEVDETYAKLADGGQAMMPPSDTFWNARFGMLADRFGKHWMLNHDRSTRG